MSHSIGTTRASGVRISPACTSSPMGRFVSYPLPAWLGGGSIWNVAIDGNGSVWLETSDGKQGVIPAGEQTVEPIDPAHPRPCLLP